MQNTRKNNLLLDIEKLIGAIDEEQEAFIARFQKDELKRDIANVVYEHKSKKMREMAKEMVKKYE